MKNTIEYLKEWDEPLNEGIVNWLKKAGMIVAMIGALSGCAYPAHAQEVDPMPTNAIVKTIENKTGVEIPATVVKEVVSELKNGNEKEAKETIDNFLFGQNTKSSNPYKIGKNITWDGKEGKGKGNIISQNSTNPEKSFSEGYKRQKVKDSFNYKEHGTRLQKEGCHYMTNINNVLELLNVPENSFTQEMFNAFTKNAKDKDWIGDEVNGTWQKGMGFFLSAGAPEKIMSSLYWMLRAGTEWNTEAGRKMWTNPKVVFERYKTLSGDDEVPDLNSLPKGTVAVVRVKAPLRLLKEKGSVIYDKQGRPKLLENGYHFMSALGRRNVPDPYSGTSRTFRYKTEKLNTTDKDEKGIIDTELARQGKTMNLDTQVRLYKLLTDKI